MPIIHTQVCTAALFKSKGRSVYWRPEASRWRYTHRRTRRIFSWVRVENVRPEEMMALIDVLARGSTILLV